MNTPETRILARQIAEFLQQGQIDESYAALAPILAERTPFRLLDIIGEAAGQESPEHVNSFLDRIAADKTEGGWVVIASALQQRLNQDIVDTFAHTRKYIIAADVWYAADTCAERVTGLALVNHFDFAVEQLKLWRSDENAWVRRAVGTGVHLWSKRSKSAAELHDRAKHLLDLLDPMFEEREMNALKGIAWGLKTLGRNYPDLMTDWLIEQINNRQRPHRAHILKKAMLGLSDEQRSRIAG